MLARPFDSCEIIVVDDGSDDGMAEILAAGRAAFPALRVLRHPRSAGQSAAIHSGVLAARYPLICTLDGDGQNPPEEIPHLLAPFAKPGTADLGLVAGQRIGRKDTLARRLASRFANGLRARVLKDATRDTGCGLKAFRREAFLALPYFDHMHRYLPAPLCPRWLADRACRCVAPAARWRTVALFQSAARVGRHPRSCRGCLAFAAAQEGPPGGTGAAGRGIPARPARHPLDAGGGRMTALMTILHVQTRTELIWVIFGLMAQLMFTGRFLVQWIASERARSSVMPVAFWYFSLVGGLMLLAYAIYRRDPVFTLGQALGVFIYARNLSLIRIARRA
jgi:lipid-A-disaccharide synthase-like uncharacterized protein